MRLYVAIPGLELELETTVRGNRVETLKAAVTPP